MEVKKFSKVLVANRSEIAIRIFRACYDLELSTVAIYSKEDALSLFRTKADEAYLVGKTKSPLGAYLDIKEIIGLAKRHSVDAIHPGYGFLSENAQFAKACEDCGITFIGPSSKTLEQMGDKLNAKAIATQCNVPIIPGSVAPLKDSAEAVEKAIAYGFPIILKAAAGGGGRGMRRCDSAEEVKTSFDLVQSESEKAFGSSDIFIEKYLEEPKHIEIQILADKYGNVVHLGERDCSLQRRYQKVVEFAPAFSIPIEVREKLYKDAVKIAKHVGYVNAGTIEFLVDKNNNHYFIEMNPRIQVEHTVTEMATGIDLVRSQILIAQGCPLSDPQIGMGSQDNFKMNGFAIQCRITTEDPANNFAPDTGKITSYRSSGGFGVRLDGGNTYTGAVVSPYYDSLLIKVTTWDTTFTGVCRKAIRAVNEVRVTGVKTNIPFITNILAHPVFQAGGCYTKFIDATPELFEIKDSKDSAGKVLKYIAELQVMSGDAAKKQLDDPRIPEIKSKPKDGIKQILDKHGPKYLSKWVLEQKKVLITDTTMRDAHQSLLSTRVRTRDMIKGAPATAEILNDCFSLEMWGGATFDVAYRFLHESPWERLDMLRESIPNIPFQMLLRGANAVGYTNYPDNVVKAFIKEAANSGIDIFRVFDSLNWIPGMQMALEEVLNQNKVCEATICYTGDILDPKCDKYTLSYYIDLAKKLQKIGAHILCIKDMSGLLKPYAAKKLITELKQEIEIPIHLHTHDTSGNQVATYLFSVDAGVDIIDTAIETLSSTTSQPSMNAVVAALTGHDRDPKFDLSQLQKLTDYWYDVRLRYSKFEADIKNPSADIYRYEIPGGQYTNLKPQVESLGLGHRFNEVKEMYKTVNDMLGDIVKVTPSSKMVGDMAIFMLKNDLTKENILSKGENLTFPDSVVSYFKGMMGQPAWGFPEFLQKIVLKGGQPITCRPGELLEPADFNKAYESVAKLQQNPTSRAVVSWCLYPKVVEEYLKHREEYGYISSMSSDIFFNGMSIGETNKITIDKGKALFIKYLGMQEVDENGMRTVAFELNGMRREIEVRDPNVDVKVSATVLADPDDKSQIGASIPGMVSKVLVKPGDAVEVNQVIAVIEAMKMETSIVSLMKGTVDKILVSEGDIVKSGELLIVTK